MAQRMAAVSLRGRESLVEVEHGGVRPASDQRLGDELFLCATEPVVLGGPRLASLGERAGSGVWGNAGGPGCCLSTMALPSI